MIKTFKRREVKANHVFTIEKIKKNTAYDFVKKYHYLGVAKFFSQHAYGLFIGKRLFGVATYAPPQGTMSTKSWVGDNTQVIVMELHRLCMHPKLNGSNASSYLLSNSAKLLKNEGVGLLITLADSSRHIGSIYQVCNFKYYGLTNKKSDFYRVDGKINPRGKTSEWQGVWMPRTRKHRYAFKLNKRVDVKLEEQVRPSKNLGTLKQTCCNGSRLVHDNRFNKTYNCPICSNKHL